MALLILVQHFLMFPIHSLKLFFLYNKQVQLRANLNKRLYFYIAWLFYIITLICVGWKLDDYDVFI